MAELQAERAELTATKASHQGQLAEINGELSGTLPMNKYVALKKQRAVLVAELNQTEMKLGQNKRAITACHAEREIAENKEFGRWRIRQLVAIRDQWHGFSMNPENPKPARQAAWKFSQELREILKSYFDNGKEDFE